jgi:hypothetical protein
LGVKAPLPPRASSRGAPPGPPNTLPVSSAVHPRGICLSFRAPGLQNELHTDVASRCDSRFAQRDSCLYLEVGALVVPRAPRRAAQAALLAKRSHARRHIDRRTSGSLDSTDHQRQVWSDVRVPESHNPPRLSIKAGHIPTSHHSKVTSSIRWAYFGHPGTSCRQVRASSVSYHRIRRS